MTTPQQQNKLYYYTPQQHLPKPNPSAFNTCSSFKLKSLKTTATTCPSTPLKKPLKLKYLYTLYPLFLDLPLLDTLPLFIQPKHPILHDFYASFDFIKSLGHGAFGSVHHCSKDHQHYAIKTFKEPLTGDKDLKRRSEEVKMMLLLSHSNHTVHLIQAWIQYSHLFIQMELCQFSLLKFLEKQTLSEDQIWDILAQITLGLRDIHALDIVHLDIKPANIFISSQNTLKIGDFGLASKCPILNPEEREGDRTYLAPEILWSSHQMTSKPADIFSLGLIALEMSCNIYLPENGPCWTQLREANFSNIDFSKISFALMDLIKSMLLPNPTERPTASDILTHPLIKPWIK
jgi:membrane-associated tyrosine/threonine-specific cdc2-inhibitory kinase